MFRPTVRKNCSRDREKLSKFEDEGQAFAKILRSLDQFFRTIHNLKCVCSYLSRDIRPNQLEHTFFRVPMKVTNNFWHRILFLTCSWRFLRSNKLEQFKFKLGFRHLKEKRENEVTFLILMRIFLEPKWFSVLFWNYAT